MSVHFGSKPGILKTQNIILPVLIGIFFCASPTRLLRSRDCNVGAPGGNGAQQNCCPSGFALLAVIQPIEQVASAVGRWLAHPVWNIW